MDNNFNLQNNYNSNDVMLMTNFDCLPQTDPTIRSKIDRMAGAAFGKALTAVILIVCSLFAVYFVVFGGIAINMDDQLIYALMYTFLLLLLMCSIVSVVLGCVALRQAKKADELAVAYGMRAGGKNIAAKVLGQIGKIIGIGIISIFAFTVLIGVIIPFPEGGIGG